MELNTTEIADLIKKRIQNFRPLDQMKTQGTLVSVTDGIVRIHGLSDVMYGEMIKFDKGLYGVALNLERDSVGAMVLGDYLKLNEGDACYCTGQILETPVGCELQGRVVDALGSPIDGKGNINAKETSPVEKVAPFVLAL